MRRRKELYRRTSSFLMIVVQLGWHCGEGRGDDGEKNGAPHRGLGRGSFFFCWEAPRVRG